MSLLRQTSFWLLVLALVVLICCLIVNYWKSGELSRPSVGVLVVESDQTLDEKESDESFIKYLIGFSLGVIVISLIWLVDLYWTSEEIPLDFIYSEVPPEYQPSVPPLALSEEVLPRTQLKISDLTSPSGKNSVLTGSLYPTIPQPKSLVSLASPQSLKSGI